MDITQTINDNREKVLSFTTQRQAVKWAIEIGINKLHHFEKFRTELFSIGVDFKKLKRDSFAKNLFYGNYQELRVPNMPKKLLSDIDNVSENLGIKRCDFVKQEMKKVISSFPEHMKTKPVIP